MKDIFSFFRIYLREFRHHIWAYLTVFLGMYFLLTAVIIPLFNLAAGAIMAASGIPFISYNNLGNILTQHTLGVLGLFGLLLLLLAAVYFQFTIQFTAVKLIQTGDFSVKSALTEGLRQLRQLNWKMLLFFLFYFLLILPFGKFVFKTPLLDKIQIPAFTMEFFLAKPQNMLILVLFYVVTFIVGNRFILVLPYLILEKMTLREAVKASLAQTRGLRRLIYFFTNFAAIGLVPLLVTQVLYYTLYGLQILCDHTEFSLVTAVIFLTLIEALNFLWGVLTLMLFYSFLLSQLAYRPAEENTKPKQQAKSRIFKLIVLSSTALILSAIAVINVYYLQGATISRPLTISHRGVDAENGVQNTLPALMLTSKEKPDYVEMDIQETKDHQFVVFHDANLQNLAGINQKPQNMTLSELTQLTIHENGKSAKIASFDAYFAEAERLQQKLLIEIKTSPLDSPDIVERFIQKYGARIVKNGDMVHSLDYSVVSSLKKLSPKIPVSFILPFNIIFPETPADAYTMEATTLNESFVATAHTKGKKVFAWTVNDPTTMQDQMVNGVDGIITDNLAILKEQIAAYKDHPTYATRIKMFISLIPAVQSPAND